MQDMMNLSKRQAFSKEDAVELLRQNAVQIFSAFDVALEKYKWRYNRQARLHGCGWTRNCCTQK